MAKKIKVFKPYTTYKFNGQDPICGQVNSVLEETGTTASAASRASGVASTTIGNWRSGKTKRPQFATVNAVLMAAGRQLTIVKRFK